MKSKQKKRLAILTTITLLIAWSAVVYFIGSEAIVEFLGVRNGYALLFFIALFGGMSSFTGVSYPATILTLASGGLSPAYLALVSAAGIIIGDTVYFYVSHHSSKLIEGGKTKGLISRFSRWLNKKPKWLVFVVVYVYTGFTPLPNDLLTISLGLARQPYFLVITALALGSLTFTYLLATVGSNFLVFLGS